MITYEYPLNERIRTLLRLEDLFERSRHFIARTDPLDHHVALLTLFEILEVASRADLKSDLLQELERQEGPEGELPQRTAPRAPRRRLGPNDDLPAAEEPAHRRGRPGRVPRRGHDHDLVCVDAKDVVDGVRDVLDGRPRVGVDDDTAMKEAFAQGS